VPNHNTDKRSEPKETEISNAKISHGFIQDKQKQIKEKK